MGRYLLGAVLLGGAIAAGLWVAQELQSPVSSVRLFVADVLERVRNQSKEDL